MVCEQTSYLWHIKTNALWDALVLEGQVQFTVKFSLFVQFCRSNLEIWTNFQVKIYDKITKLHSCVPAGTSSSNSSSTHHKSIQHLHFFKFQLYQKKNHSNLMADMTDQSWTHGHNIILLNSYIYSVDFCHTTIFKKCISLVSVTRFYNNLSKHYSFLYYSKSCS